MPLKSLGQDVLNGIWISGLDDSKLSKTQKDSLCHDLYEEIDSIQNERISCYSQSNSYLKKYQKDRNPRFLELADSLEKQADFYFKLKYTYLKKRIDKIDNFYLK